MNNERSHAAERKAVQGHIRARDLEARPDTASRRCRNCRYFAGVFDATCSYGDFRTTKSATCRMWTPKR